MKNNYKYNSVGHLFNDIYFTESIRRLMCNIIIANLPESKQFSLIWEKVSSGNFIRIKESIHNLIYDFKE